MGVARSPQVRQQLQSPVSSVQCMTLLFSSSPASLLLIMTDTTAAADKEFDTLDLRNRTVTETLSPLEDFGQNGTEENGKEKEDETEEGEKYDKLVLRNRTVTET